MEYGHDNEMVPDPDSGTKDLGVLWKAENIAMDQLPSGLEYEPFG